jgi:hypothetical protein
LLPENRQSPKHEEEAMLNAKKAKTGGVSFGRVGAGHISHPTMELLQRRACSGGD